MSKSTTKKNDQSMVFGSYEDALAMIGWKSPRQASKITPSSVLARLFCGVIEDSNRSYWDHQFSAGAWGAPIVPPGMMLSWSLSFPWSPSNDVQDAPLCISVPLPGTRVINSTQSTEFFEPVQIDQILYFEESLLSVSEEKSSHIGRGHFVTTRTQFWNAQADLVAYVDNSVFRYVSAEEKSGEPS